jgi:3',5'-cyclic AMP phosphodiesterase CpdA
VPPKAYNPFTSRLLHVVDEIPICRTSSPRSSGQHRPLAKVIEQTGIKRKAVSVKPPIAVDKGPLLSSRVAGETTMAALAPIDRKDPRYVRIVQISDLHFSEQTKYPRRPPSDGPAPGDLAPDAFLTKLVDDIAKQQPDVICVTGDVADSKLLDAVKENTLGFFDRWLSRKETPRDYVTVLRKTFNDARRFFEYVCEEVKIDPATSLFVIPGNHDYRPQGLLAEDPERVRIFGECFAPYMESRRLLFRTVDAGAIGVTLVCIDSNRDKTAAPLATGAITENEFLKFDFFRRADKVWGEAGIRGAATFGICLVHHHPLPVVPAENYRELKNNAGVIETLRDTYRHLTGVQTTLLKNAGAFLCAAADAKVDLVLHGHDHKAWFSELRYPRTDDEHRLFVAAAGSAGVQTEGAYSYNVASLLRDGRIRLENRRLDTGQQYAGGTSFPVYTPGQYRAIRHEKARATIRKKPLTAKYLAGTGITHGGALKAERVGRLTQLKSNGNAEITRQYEKLEAQVPNVRQLPLTSTTPGYVGMIGALKIEQTHTGGRRYDIRHKESTSDAASKTITHMLEFDPPLEPNYPVTFSVSYLLCNGYDFVQELRRGRVSTDQQERTPDGCEAVARTSQMIFADRVSETVMFPPGWMPQEAPRVRAYDDAGTVDSAEQDYCDQWLHYFTDSKLAAETSGFVSWTLDLPMPDIIYEISWKLWPKAELEKQKGYSEASLERLKRIAQREAWGPEVTRKLQDLLLKLRAEFSNELEGLDGSLMDERTELSLFVVRHEDCARPGKPSSMKVVLVRRAHLEASDGPRITLDRMEAGVGIAGQAFRSDWPVCDASAGKSGLYKMVQGQDTVHEFLLGIALPAKKAGEAGRHGTAPCYGVLCVGSFSPGHSLMQLDHESVKGKAAKALLIDRVIGWFAQETLEVLSGVPSREDRSS